MGCLKLHILGQDYKKPELKIVHSKKRLSSEKSSSAARSDYGARWYDPATARWSSVDPLAEKYYGYSGYNYVLGNPVNNIDPDGRIVLPAIPVILKGLGLLWGALEVGLTAYDVYDTYSTVTDPNASNLTKSVSLGGLALGIFLPGGGYGKVSKVTAEDVLKIGKRLPHAVKHFDELPYYDIALGTFDAGLKNFAKKEKAFMFDDFALKGFSSMGSGWTVEVLQAIIRAREKGGKILLSSDGVFAPNIGKVDFKNPEKLNQLLKGDPLNPQTNNFVLSFF